MGILISRFRKQASTTDKLKSLVKEIKEIEQFGLYTQQRQKSIVGRFIIFSVLIFFVAFGFYFIYLPKRLVDIIIYIIPFFLFPVIILNLKRIITWYFSRKLTSNEKRLASLKEEKKKILDDVMEKETYKTAKEILEQFAPEQLRKEPSTAVVPRVAAPVVRSSPMVRNSFAPDGSQDLRHRSVFPTPRAGQPPTPAGWRNMPLATPNAPNTPFQQRLNLPPGPPMARPVLPRERSVMDKVVEYIFGDGPSNRFALVCRQCASHNGMAMQEEFEYLAFRCCYCFAWNPARKQRPQAPLLPISASSQDEGESSPSTVSSDTEGEGEQQEQVKTETQTDNQIHSQASETETSETLPTIEPSAPEEQLDTTPSTTEETEKTPNPDS